MADPGRSPSRDRANGEEEKRRRSPDEPPRPDGDFKIFVGGISWHMNDRELKDTFRAFNAKTATVMLDKMTHRSRGFGFVTFDTEQDLLAAIKEMHDSELEGRKISCNRAIPQSETAPGTPASALADGTGPGRSARPAGGTFQRGRVDTYERGGGAAAYAAPYERGAYAAPRGGAYDGRRDAYDRGGYGAAPARGGYGDYDRYGAGRGDFDRFGDRGGFGAQYGGAGGYDRPDPYYPPRDPGYPPRDPYADRGYGGYEAGGYDRGGYGSSFASPAGGYDRGYDDRYARGPPPMRDAYRRPDPYAAPGRSR